MPGGPFPGGLGGFEIKAAARVSRVQAYIDKQQRKRANGLRPASKSGEVQIEIE